MTIAPILAQGPTSNMPAVIFHLITSVRQLWRTTPVLLARVQTSILLRSRWKLSNLASYMLLYTIIGDRVYRRCYLRGHPPPSQVVNARDNWAEAKLGHFAKYKKDHPLRNSQS